MATWKEIVFTDDVENLGNTDLTQADDTRDYTLKQSPGVSTSKKLRVMSETTDGVTQALLDIRSPSFNPGGGGSAIGGSFRINTGQFLLTSNSNAVIYFQSSFHLNTSGLLVDAPTATIRDSNENAEQGPILILDRDSSNPDVSDLIGQISFRGRDDEDESTTYATITGSIVDQTNGAEDGGLDIKLITGGSQTSALKIIREPILSELTAGSAASPVFYTDNIDLYGHSIRQRLLNEIGVTIPFGCVFYPTKDNTSSNAGIETNYEVWGIASQDSYSTFGTGALPHERSVRFATAQTTNVGDTVSYTSRNAAFDISEGQVYDLGGASWIVCHHDQGVTPSISNGTGRVYDFNGSFFYKASDYATGGDTIDNEQTGTIRIYQATTTGGVLATSGEAYTLKLMAKENITFLDTAELTTVVFSLSFKSDINVSSGHDVFIVSFENTGPQTLGSNDDNDAFSPYSVPFIKGEITRRIANVDDT